MAKGIEGFLSSNCWDILGAKDLGFRKGCLNRSKFPRSPLHFAQDELPGSLAELVEMGKA